MATSGSITLPADVIRELRALTPTLLKAASTPAPDDFAALCAELRVAQLLGGVLQKAMVPPEPRRGSAAFDEQRPPASAATAEASRAALKRQRVALQRTMVDLSAERRQMRRELATMNEPSIEQRRQQVDAIMAKAMVANRTGKISAVQIARLEAEAARIMRGLGAHR